jgi:PAS domain S-box-containing protein
VSAPWDTLLPIGIALIAVAGALAAWGAVHIRRLRARLESVRAELTKVDSEATAAARRIEGLKAEVDSRQKENEAARSATETLRGRLEALPEPIWVRDADLKLIHVNRAYAQLADTSAEKVLADSVELTNAADRAAALELGKTALETGKPQSRRFHVVASGQRILLEVTEQPLADGTLLGHARDLTDMEELQSDLDRHLQAQSAVLENLNVGIAILRADMRLGFFNAAYTRLWQLDESFLASQPHITDVWERLREERRLPEQADFGEYKRQTLRSYQTLIDPIEELIHLPDGATLRLTVYPHPFGGAILAYEDVTDSLKLERTYNTLLEVQRETLDNLYEGVAVYGADGRLKLHNPAFARIWQLPGDLLQSQPHVRQLIEHTRALYPVENTDWEDYAERMAARASEPEHTSGRMERADGSVIDWAQVPLPDGASLYTFIDVTDTTRVERALRERNEALETIDRLKSEFIANISYELRTPLNAIIGFAEILENKYFGALNERQMEYARAIVESSQRLITLINDILDLASIEAGYLQLERGSVDVHALLVNTQNLVRERARERRLAVVIDCPPEIGAIQADERRLTQALFNLISNAVKFTPEGGTLTLRADRGEEEMQLSVADTGVGIHPQDRERVFGKFERGRLAAALTNREQGAGLGLSLVKSLVELHGGWIDLESEVNEGTTVTCHLPIVAPEAAAEGPSLPASESEPAEGELSGADGERT